VARQEISDDVWAVIEPLLSRVSGRSRALLPHRHVVEGWCGGSAQVRRGVTCLSGSGRGTPGMVPLSPHSVCDISSWDVENRAMAPTQSCEHPYRGAEWKE